MTIGTEEIGQRMRNMPRLMEFIWVNYRLFQYIPISPLIHRIFGNAF